MGLFLAALASVLWGTGDFAGGSATRRLPALVVVGASQAVGLVGVVLVAVVAEVFGAPAGYLPWAIAAGATGAIALVAFYQALATGTMGVVSPIGALSVVVPVAWGLASGQWPGPVVGAGIVVAIVGVVAASGPERGRSAGLRPLLLAAVAAVGFGLTIVFLAEGARYSPLMTTVAMRATSVPLVAALIAVGVIRARRVRRSSSRRRQRSDGRRGRVLPHLALLVAAAGLCDVAANLVFALASTRGSLTIVAILGSLYPAVTVLLARIVHGERLARIQQAGVALALVGVALIAGGA